LASIRRLYVVESDATAAKLDDDARRALRQERSVPILEELFAWLEGVRAQVLPKSPMGEAIGYALNHKAALLRYVEQGFLEIDNNASERGEKTIAIGRRNWLFFGSEAGGGPVQLDRDLPTAGRRAVGLLAGRAGSSEHAPGKPDRGVATRPLGGDSSRSRRSDTSPGLGCVGRGARSPNRTRGARAVIARRP
jgi:hypothetical protein